RPDAGRPPGGRQRQALAGSCRSVRRCRPLIAADRSRRPQGVPMNTTDIHHPTLATDGQTAMERLALALFERPEVRAAREQARKLLLADPVAPGKDGAAGLDRALDQWVMGQIASIINADPSRPVLLWAVDNTPRAW